MKKKNCSSVNSNPHPHHHYSFHSPWSIPFSEPILDSSSSTSPSPSPLSIGSKQSNHHHDSSTKSSLMDSSSNHIPTQSHPLFPNESPSEPPSTNDISSFEVTQSTKDSSEFVTWNNKLYRKDVLASYAHSSSSVVHPPSRIPSPNNSTTSSYPPKRRLLDYSSSKPIASKLIQLNGNQYLQSKHSHLIRVSPPPPPPSSTSSSLPSSNLSSPPFPSNTHFSYSNLQSQPTQNANWVKTHKPKIMDSKYCYYYHRFGTCRSGTQCSYLHDPTRVSLCRALLFRIPHSQNECPFNHTPTPYNTPFCQYFQEGKCTSSPCLFLHVKLGTTAPICPSFQHGYCSLGLQCTKKHVWKTKASTKSPVASSEPASSTSTSEDNEYLAFSSSDDEAFLHREELHDTSDFIYFSESDLD